MEEEFVAKSETFWPINNSKRGKGVNRPKWTLQQDKVTTINRLKEGKIKMVENQVSETENLNKQDQP